MLLGWVWGKIKRERIFVDDAAGVVKSQQRDDSHVRIEGVLQRYLSL